MKLYSLRDITRIVAYEVYAEYPSQTKQRGEKTIRDTFEYCFSKCSSNINARFS